MKKSDDFKGFIFLKVGVMRKISRLLLGCFLVVLGVIGIILPIMPGWVFLIPGLLILSDYFPPLRRLVEFCERKYKEHEPEAVREKRERFTAARNRAKARQQHGACG